MLGLDLQGQEKLLGLSVDGNRTNHSQQRLAGTVLSAAALGHLQMRDDPVSRLSVQGKAHWQEPDADSPKLGAPLQFQRRLLARSAFH
jgi:hypothetical protein